MLFVHFLKCLLLFFGDNVDEESEYFTNNESSAPEFCQFQPDIAYKSVAYKKRIFD